MNQKFPQLDSQIFWVKNGAKLRVDCNQTWSRIGQKGYFGHFKLKH